MLDATSGWAWSNGVEGQYSLLRTTDGGQTWSDVTPRTFPYLECRAWFFNSRTAWVSTLDRKTYSGGLLRTTDGGKSESVLVKEGTAPFQCLTAEGSNCEFLNANHVVARTADYGLGSVYVRFFETQDGGMTWTPVIITVGDMADEKAKGAVSLSLSTNLGKSWRELKLPVPDQYRSISRRVGSSPFARLLRQYKWTVAGASSQEERRHYQCLHLCLQRVGVLRDR